MKNIKFIRKYKFYGTEKIDIIYNSNRCMTCDLVDAPKTARDFMKEKSYIVQHDHIHGKEAIYR